MAMSIEKARDIVAHIVAQQVRWGKLYDAEEIGLKQLVEALIAIAQGDSEEVTEVRKSLATANRQVGAANAREARYKKQIEELKNENEALTRLCHDLTERMPSVIDGDTDGPAEDGERED